MTYLILSLKWSAGKDMLVWWGPNNGGYTFDIDKAGRYTAEQVRADPGYYDNGESTMAVPVEQAEARAIRTVNASAEHFFREAQEKTCPTT